MCSGYGAYSGIVGTQLDESRSPSLSLSIFERFGRSNRLSKPSDLSWRSSDSDDLQCKPIEVTRAICSGYLETLSQAEHVVDVRELGILVSGLGLRGQGLGVRS